MSPQDRLSLILVQLLEPAMAAGMAEPRAREIYDSLVACYAQATGQHADFPELVLANIREALDHGTATN